MAIDFRNPLANHGALLERLRSMMGRTGSQDASSGPKERQTDTVSLSDDAQRIADNLRGTAPVSRNDAERIATLKQAIESGTFRIDSDRIADKVSLQYGSV